MDGRTSRQKDDEPRNAIIRPFFFQNGRIYNTSNPPIFNKSLLTMWPFITDDSKLKLHAMSIEPSIRTCIFIYL